MKRAVLDNGITVLHVPKPGKSVAVNVLVRAGSNMETKEIFGISHFIEHMVFEGTEKRSALEISRAIEGLGGDLNAYTTNEKTCFSVKSLNRHFAKSLEILSDIIINPLFDQKAIDKERQIILSEVKMREDQPRFRQWDMFMDAAFKGKVPGHPVIGYSSTVRGISREQIVDYHDRHYCGSNIIIAVAGSVKDPMTAVRKHFRSLKRGRKTDPKNVSGGLKSSRTVREKHRTKQTYLVYGFPTVPVTNKDSIILDVIRAILGKGLSGRLFDEIRNKRGLGYDVGCLHDSNKGFGFFACYASAVPKNITQCQRIIVKELARVGEITDRELQEAKNYLEGEFTFDYEANDNLADVISWLEYCGITRDFSRYMPMVRKVTRSDIKRVAKRYFTKGYARALIHSA